MNTLRPEPEVMRRMRAVIVDTTKRVGTPVALVLGTDAFTEYRDYVDAGRDMDHSGMVWYDFEGFPVFCRGNVYPPNAVTAAAAPRGLSDGDPEHEDRFRPHAVTRDGRRIPLPTLGETLGAIASARRAAAGPIQEQSDVLREREAGKQMGLYDLEKELGELRERCAQEADPPAAAFAGRDDLPHPSRAAIADAIRGLPLRPPPKPTIKDFVNRLLTVGAPSKDDTVTLRFAPNLFAELVDFYQHHLGWVLQSGLTETDLERPGVHYTLIEDKLLAADTGQVVVARTDPMPAWHTGMDVLEQHATHTSYRTIKRT